jgi:hypothetical protein
MKVQVLRCFGVLALINTNQYILPALLAIPTGILDLVFAITSFFVAARLVWAKGSPNH